MKQGNESLEERLWRDVKRAADDECWEWQGSCNKGGYGQFTLNGVHHFVHVVSYVLHYGPLAKGPLPHGSRRRCVCHACDNRRCVNPSHLWYGTQSDNMLDAVRKGRLKLSPFIQQRVEAKAERLAAKRAEREQRLADVIAGKEKVRDAYGRFGLGHTPRQRDAFGRLVKAGSEPLPPRRRDAAGHFVK